jgi:tRNA-dihydrouridine synthase
MNFFWHTLQRPFTALSPMEGVTDPVFRKIISEIGRPDVFFTEFVSAEGLNSLGREKVKVSLRFEKRQLPIVAQLWGKNPDDFYTSSKLCKEMGFSGIDINMGCPDRVIVKKGSCAGLINNPDLAQKIIMHTQKGSKDLPVSVKTRLGYLQQNLDWIKFLLQQNLAALTIHLRTVEELSKVPARWDMMSEIIKLRDEISPNTLIIGNGDVMSLSEIEEKFRMYHCDGCMIGRGIFQNPWLFNKNVDEEKVTPRERLDVFIKHITLYDLFYNGKYPAVLKKFCKIYISNFSDSSSLREKIMECAKTSEMLEILNAYRNNLF